MKTNTEKKVAIISFIIVAYFLLLYGINFFKIDWVIIGVFRELLTIPFLIAQLVFLFLGIRFLLLNKFQNILTILSVLLLLVSSIFTFGSFF